MKLDTVLQKLAARLTSVADDWAEPADGRDVCLPSVIASIVELRDIIETVESECAIRTMTTAWQPIETAPRDGTKIVAIHEEGVDICWYAEAQPDAPDDMGCDAGWWGLAYSYPGRSFGNPNHFHKPQGQPTHWLPLPEPPQ